MAGLTEEATMTQEIGLDGCDGALVNSSAAVLFEAPEATETEMPRLAAVLQASTDIGAALIAAKGIKALVSRHDDDGSAVSAIASNDALVARLVELMSLDAFPELQLEVGSLALLFQRPA